MDWSSFRRRRRPGRSDWRISGTTGRRQFSGSSGYNNLHKVAYKFKSAD